MITRVLTKTGATVRACGVMYKSVDQLVLLYGSESWVVTGEMLKVLEGFQKPGGPADHWYECNIRRRHVTIK